MLTRKVLPPCSMKDCDNAAGAIINGALYCSAHAVDQIKTRVLRGEQRLRPAQG